MSILLANVTGATVTGFTAPVYNVTADTAPAQNAKQWAVTSLGGTQVGVTVNAVSKPFTFTFFRPQVLRSLPAANPVTGVIKSIPVNTYKAITRKGAAPAVNQSAQTIKISTVFDVQAGVDTYEPAELKAAISMHIGALTQLAAGISDTLVNGVL
jgi:hypothetical protein